MDRVVIDQKLESLRRCLSRIRSKEPLRPETLETDLALQLKKSVGFRNVAVHNYSTINWGVVHSIVQEHLKDFDEYVYRDPHIGGVNEEVNEGVNILVKLIIQQPGMRSPALADALNTSVKNIERWLKQLKEQGQIEFRGAPKSGGYYPKKNEPNHPPENRHRRHRLRRPLQCRAARPAPRSSGERQHPRET